MATKMLGKVVAGAALGGASLLVFTPGFAFADHDGDRGGDHGRGEGKVFAKPDAVKPGHEVKIYQVCSEPQEHAYVWSKVTGKVKLSPVRDGMDDNHGDWKDRHDRDWKDRHDRDGGDEGRKDSEGDEGGKGDDGGKGPKPTPTASPTASPTATAKPDGKGGGFVASDQAGDEGRDAKDEHRYDWDGHDWKGHEGDQAGEEGHDRKDHEGRDKKDHDGRDKKDHDGYGDRWEHKRDFVYYGEAKVASDATPGEYKLKGSCGDGKLLVLPKGHVDGGDGGQGTGTNRGLATAGAGVLGAAALGGIVLMRRRRNNESLV